MRAYAQSGYYHTNMEIRGGSLSPTPILLIVWSLSANKNTIAQDSHQIVRLKFFWNKLKRTYSYKGKQRPTIVREGSDRGYITKGKYLHWYEASLVKPKAKSWGPMLKVDIIIPKWRTTIPNTHNINSQIVEC